MPLKISPAPPMEEAFNTQVDVPVEAYRAVCAAASTQFCTVQDVLYSALLADLPRLESAPEGTINLMPRRCKKVRPGLRVPSEMMKRIDAVAARMDRWNDAHEVLLPGGGSRSAVLFLCLRNTLPDVGSPAPMHTDPRGVMRIIPVFLPAHVTQWIDDHASSRSQYLRRALVYELPAVDADPLVRRGAATYPRGAPDWKESRVRVPLDCVEYLKRVAKRKRMPWAELARVCALRAVKRDITKEKS